jgi:signal transduction histidine kinase
LENLFEQTGGRRSEAYRELVERGLQALDRVRKWTDELHGVLIGRKSGVQNSSFDPGRVVRSVVGALQSEYAEAELELDVLMPAQLPVLQGDAALFESALMQLLRQRLSEASVGGSVTVSVRPLGEKVVKAVLVSVVDCGLVGSSDENAGARPASLDLQAVREAAVALGGRIETLLEADRGRVVAMKLNTAS